MTLAGDTTHDVPGARPGAPIAVERAPVRTCVGCREARPQAALLRFGRRADGHIMPANVTRDRRGRSAYVCPRRACLEQACKRNAFTRAFGAGRQRVSVIDVDIDLLWSASADQLQREIDLLGRTSLNPHAHPRRRGLEQLLSELSSQPHAPERSASSKRSARTGRPTQAQAGTPTGAPAHDETSRPVPPASTEGGAPNHG
jgi:predicted RNA-binding protein YlxR (DUF448 family)